MRVDFVEGLFDNFDWEYLTLSEADAGDFDLYFFGVDD